jgi:hypothetical protein
MSARDFDRVEDWESRPFDGQRDLQALADEEFTGAVRAGGTWVFLLNGRVVGEFGGTVEGLGDATGTAYVAPHPALALLLVMREAGGETRARYYTNDTPLTEVDDTLASSNFTGYVELSENVLSGDYYVVYYGGRSLSVAFVGERGELITDEDAFERADDEVGIFEVVSSEVEVKEVPEPDHERTAAAAGADGDDESDAQSANSADATDAAGAGAAAGAADAVTEAEPEDGTDTGAAGAVAPSETGPDDDPADAGESTADRAPAEGGGEPEAVDDAEDRRRADDESPAAEAPPTDRSSQPATGAGTVEGDGPRAERAPETDTESGSDAVTETEPATDVPAEPETDVEDSDGREDAAARAEPGAGATNGAESGDPRPGPASAEGVESRTEAPPGTNADKFSREAEWRETNSIPALDPEESTNVKGDGPEANPDSGPDGTRDRGPPERTTRDEAENRVRQLRTALEERTDELEQLRGRVADLEAERDDLVAERETVREERDRLADRVEELEDALAAAEARAEVTGDADAPTEEPSGATVDPERALAETNLFVQYDSQGGAPTLSDAHDGADADEVNANLQLEHHAQFEAEGATVEGEPYAAFLTATPEYRFVEWVVRELLYEIREAGHRSELGPLYDAIPEVYRVELRGTVEVPAGEDDETAERAFDVILRDRMGAALMVADLNDSRDPVTGAMMEGLVDAAGDAAAVTDLAAAFYVTASFFAPDSLDEATEATSGGLFSRGSKESFVKTDRKNGYHLCLVESREDSFYLTVPEL